MKSILIALGISTFILFYYLHAYHKIDWFRSNVEVAQTMTTTQSPGEEAAHALEIADVKKHKGVQIGESWEMPDDLFEISGMQFIAPASFACIQDEAGKIFIYNSATKKIEREIDFGKKGDYEAIALVNNTAYVARSDGHIFEVMDINSEKPEVKEYETPLGSKQNVEGICYDKKYNRLLVSIKDRDDHSKDFKGIYEFNLATKKLKDEPVYRINSEDDKLETKKGKYTEVRPSDIGINPANDLFYITDGPSRRLLIMDRNNKIHDLLEFDKDDFPQPEGVCFSPSGKMYISSEGAKKIEGTIKEVSLRED